MKGIVFVEFLEMVDEKFGYDVTEEIIKKSDLASGGAYTSIGTYPHSEIVALTKNLSAITNIEADILVKNFGQYLIMRFQTLFPQYFENIDDALTLLENVNDYIHAEVRKLYEDVQLPEISTQRTLDEGLILNYKSVRRMGDLAEGMISGAIEIFGSKYELIREDLQERDNCQCIIFTLKKKVPIN